jgi:hypothetical protein
MTELAQKLAGIAASLGGLFFLLAASLEKMINWLWFGGLLFGILVVVTAGVAYVNLTHSARPRTLAALNRHGGNAALQVMFLALAWLYFLEVWRQPDAMPPFLRGAAATYLLLQASSIWWRRGPSWLIGFQGELAQDSAATEPGRQV